VPEDGVIYLKVDSAVVGEDDLARFAQRPAQA